MRRRESIDITDTDRWYLTCWTILRDHYGRPPSERELARYIARHHSTAHEALRRLEDAGLLVRDRDGVLTRA